MSVEEACVKVQEVIDKHYLKSTDWVREAMEEIESYNDTTLSNMFAYAIV